MNETDRIHPLRVLLPILIAILSVTILGNIFSSPKTYQASTSYLDEKEENVLALTAGATAASVGITMLPGDVGTPLAEKFADLSDYFIAISVAILFEKYLTTIAGVMTFHFLIPFAMLFLILSFYWKNNTERLRQIAVKLLIFGVVVTAVVPLSTYLSDNIDATYQGSLEKTITEVQENTDQLNALTENMEEQSETAQSETETESGSEQKPKSVWNALGDTFSGAVDTMEGAAKSVGDAASSTVSSIAGRAEDLAGNFKEMLNDMVNAIAVLLVTSCVIPLAVLFFLIWITKTLFSISLPVIPLKSGVTQRAMNGARRMKEEHMHHEG